MELDEIERIKGEFSEKDADREALREGLRGIEKAFNQRGNLSDWSPEVLDEIDLCFMRHYMPNGEPNACLFLPNNAENLNLFTAYFNDVDQVLRVHSRKAPRYAREYFTFFSIWHIQSYRFPMPLGTASVVGALNMILKKITRGFTEVGTCFLRLLHGVASAVCAMHLRIK
jgi:hypothetical protein